MPVTRQTTICAAQFAYSPLDRDVGSSFRIVTVLPGELHTPLSCTLSLEDWRNPTNSYEAVSYFWGERLHPKTIRIDGRSFQVTSNLESALQHLRHGEEGQHRRLWVDAICINQKDTQERGQQVRQMFHIYNGAKQVIIWLGNATLESNKALTFINTSLGPCFESVGFSCTDEKANIVSEFWEAWDDGKDGECLEAIDHLITPRHSKSWSGVAELLLRPWWSRVWIVQELISAQKATILCGKMSVPWPLLDMTIEMMFRNTKLEDLYSRRKQELFHMAVEDAYGFAFERSHRILDGTGSLDLVMLMQITRYRDCQDPRDKVFSVLSLLSEDFQAYFYPDYLQPIQTVYASAVRSHIQHTGDLHILSSAYLSKQASISKLPSWVPDWGRAFEMSFLGGYSSKDSDYYFRASGNLPAVFSFSDDLHILTVTGLEIDTVQSNRLQGTDDDFEYWYEEDQGQKEPSCSWDIHDIVAELERSRTAVITGNHDASVAKAVFRTLIVDTDSLSGKRRQDLKITRQKGKVWPEPLEDYLAHVRLWTQERSLIISTGGYMGLAPSSTLPGDWICVLHGFHAPVILRPRTDNCYTYVGDAYVDTLMNGEAVASERTEDFKSKQFMIR
jgi:Heterokaryon incompatibility protein (HET)